MLVDVQDYGFLIDISGNKKYSTAQTLYLEKDVLESLLRAQKDLPNKYRFVIKYGFRTLEEQRKIVETTARELQISNPDNWLQLLNIYTGGYEELKLKEDEISFMNHRSGYAVDLTLSQGEQEVDMGGVSLNKRDELDYYENKENLSENDINIRDNRRILKKTLEKHGFKGYPLEWWHWGYSRDS